MNDSSDLWDALLSGDRDRVATLLKGDLVPEPGMIPFAAEEFDAAIVERLIRQVRTAGGHDLDVAKMLTEVSQAFVDAWDGENVPISDLRPLDAMIDWYEESHTYSEPPGPAIVDHLRELYFYSSWLPTRTESAPWRSLVTISRVLQTEFRNEFVEQVCPKIHIGIPRVRSEAELVATVEHLSRRWTGLSLTPRSQDQFWDMVTGLEPENLLPQTTDGWRARSAEAAELEFVFAVAHCYRAAHHLGGHWFMETSPFFRRGRMVLGLPDGNRLDPTAWALRKAWPTRPLASGEERSRYRKGIDY